MLAFSIANPIYCLAQDIPQSQCGKVMNGAVLNFIWECWNDASFLISQPNKTDFAGWQYTEDGGLNDGAGASEFDIFGLAFHETNGEVWFVINSNLSLLGYEAPEALGGTITYGDVFLNLTSMSFVDAMNSGNLFGIRFDPKNDSYVPTGLYKSVTASSVVDNNLGLVNRQGYESHIFFQGGIPGYGDLPFDMTYYPQDGAYNVINSGQFLGPVVALSQVELEAEGFNLTRFPGTYNIGFKFQKSLVIDACGVVGGDGSSCTDCAGVACGNSHIDSCGVCGGDGRSCLGCNDINIFDDLFTLDSNSARQAKILVNAAKKLLRTAGKANGNLRFSEQQTKAAHKLHQENWQLGWSIPQVITSCSNTQLCTNFDHSEIINRYNANTNELYQRTVQTVKRLRKQTRNKNAGAGILTNAKAELVRGLAAAALVPISTSKCI